MKQIILLFLVMLGMSAQAQYTSNWTASMSSSKIPSGVTLNAIDTLEDYSTIRFQFDLDATTYDNANKVTAFNAIGAAVKSTVDTIWVDDVWGLDTSLNIVGCIVIESIVRTWDNIEIGDFIGQYGVAEDVYRVRGKFKYVILN